MKSGSTTTDTDVTIQVTSTPVKKKAPPVTLSNMETMSGEAMPSEIFGFPEKASESESTSDLSTEMHTADTDFVSDYFQCVSDYLSLSARVQKALPVDQISKVSHFVLNCEK